MAVLLQLSKSDWITLQAFTRSFMQGERIDQSLYKREMVLWRFVSFVERAMVRSDDEKEIRFKD